MTKDKRPCLCRDAQAVNKADRLCRQRGCSLLQRTASAQALYRSLPSGMTKAHSRRCASFLLAKPCALQVRGKRREWSAVFVKDGNGTARASFDEQAEMCFFRGACPRKKRIGLIFRLPRRKTLRGFFVPKEFVYSLICGSTEPQIFVCFQSPQNTVK